VARPGEGRGLRNVNEDKATRYQRLKRQASIISLAWGVLLLAGLLVTGWHAALRDAAAALAARFVPAAWQASAIVFGFVALLSILNEIGSLPLGFYSGFFLERRYDLSNERLGAWLRDQAKAFAIGLVLAGGAAELIYWCIRQSPAYWWASAGALFTLLIVGLTNLAPVLLLPLFYSVKPLGRDALRTRLLSLAERAGARVLGAYEWGLGDKTRKANAALAGLGGTRRILVSDTMLAEYSDDEIEVVLAHEIAHHVHGDIWKGIVFESVLTVAGFYLASRVLLAMAGAVGLQGVDDVAGLPLLLLAAGAVSVVMLPAAHAMSRAFERSADRFALELTRNPAAFISAMRRLGAQNLAEDDPSPLVQWLFHSHPPMRERIAAAQAHGHPTA
jgi:STE24 endopeptidase